MFFGNRYLKWSDTNGLSFAENLFWSWAMSVTRCAIYDIWKTILLSLWSTPLSSRRVDRKDRSARLITCSALLLVYKFTISHFDQHLKSINTSAVDQNTIFKSRYQGLITKLCWLNTKTGKLKVIALCNTMMNVSHSLYGIQGWKLYWIQ